MHHVMNMGIAPVIHHKWISAKRVITRISGCEQHTLHLKLELLAC